MEKEIQSDQHLLIVLHNVIKAVCTERAFKNICTTYRTSDEITHDEKIDVTIDKINKALGSDKVVPTIIVFEANYSTSDKSANHDLISYLQKTYPDAVLIAKTGCELCVEEVRETYSGIICLDAEHTMTPEIHMIKAMLDPCVQANVSKKLEANSQRQIFLNDSLLFTKKRGRDQVAGNEVGVGTLEEPRKKSLVIDY